MFWVPTVEKLWNFCGNKKSCFPVQKTTNSHHHRILYTSSSWFQPLKGKHLQSSLLSHAISWGGKTLGRFWEDKGSDIWTHFRGFGKLGNLFSTPFTRESSIMKICSPLPLLCYTCVSQRLGQAGESVGQSWNNENKALWAHLGRLGQLGQLFCNFPLYVRARNAIKMCSPSPVVR